MEACALRSIKGRRGVSRKSDLKAMFAGAAPEAKSAAAAPEAMVPSAPPTAVRPSSGAVKAMGLALGDLAQRAGEAETLRAEIEKLKAGAARPGQGGDAIVELDPAVIDPSPFADRLSAGSQHDASFAELVRSIGESGQQVPVLVRPHPAEEGRYQAAYGHRRIRAAKEAGKPVKAVIRPLDDAGLMLAQGKENAERRDLSFIEKALFAQTLADAGFVRAAIQTALAVHASELTRLLQVAQAVPAIIARAIGPAPKAGRPRWMALGAHLRSAEARGRAGDVIASERFLAADSDTRFAILFDRLSGRLPPMPKAARPVIAGDGSTLANFTGGVEPALRFQANQSAFAEWLADNLADLRKRYEAEGWG
jgi:ParB family transcriptional regulator, chromosome partitioning protein